MNNRQLEPRRSQELIGLLERLGIDSRKLADQTINWQLLDQALIHPTFSPDLNNDKLEFLGDSVLRLTISLFLRENYGSASVGQLASLRSHLASDATLTEIADGYDLDRFMVMSNSARNDPRSRRSRLADALEALLAALYLSTNDFSLIRPWLNLHLQRKAKSLLNKPNMGNYKAALQELTQGRWKLLPEYRNVDVKANAKANVQNAKTNVQVEAKNTQQVEAKAKSPNIAPKLNKQLNKQEPQSHKQDEIFAVEIWFLDKCWAYGEGLSIKAAQQRAAERAYAALNDALSNGLTGDAIDAAQP